MATTSPTDVAAIAPRNARRSSGAPRTAPAARGSRRTASRVAAALAPTCTTSAPIVVQATQKCARGKKNDHGYHSATLSVPDSTWNSAPPTRGTSASRSTACRTERAGGHSKKRGWTTHSFASSNGIAAMPLATWSPCVMRYSPAGRAG